MVHVSMGNKDNVNRREFFDRQGRENEAPRAQSEQPEHIKPNPLGEDRICDDPRPEN